MTSSTETQTPAPLTAADLQVWLGYQRDLLQNDTNAPGEFRANRETALRVVGNTLGHLATRRGQEPQNIGAQDVVGHLYSGEFEGRLSSQLRTGQQAAFKVLRGELDTAIANPEDVRGVLRAMQLAREINGNYLDEAELQRLVGDVLGASKDTAEIFMSNPGRMMHFGPGSHGDSRSRGGHHEPWDILKHSPEGHTTSIGEATAFTPSRRLVMQPGKPRSFGRSTPPTQAVSRATMSGEPLTDVSYSFSPSAFNGQHLLPEAEWPRGSVAAFRVAVPESMGKRIKAGGPQASRAIMEALVQEYGRSGEPAARAAAWRAHEHGVRPPYESLPSGWRMNVLDASAKNPETVVNLLHDLGGMAPLAQVYDIRSIPAPPLAA
jgi:hypothetical protein